MIRRTLRLVLCLPLLAAVLFLTASAGAAQEPLSPQPGEMEEGSLIEPSVEAAGQAPTDEWSTVAANPQRTSWVSEEIDTSNLHVEWYRPIEAYIPQNVQIIAANGLLYISTSRGLYALYATDPDDSGPLRAGDVKWRFDTELPLGNSPTVADGTVYVAGFDRKIHALDALTGVHLWAFEGAGAGFSTNPLVVDGRVFAGNRDGYMYAVGAQGTSNQGQLLWKYKTGGSITLSAAYADGAVYFASNDSYAYALDANTPNPDGALIWKSAKLPGDGFQSYWPVVYQDKVVFAGSSGYRQNLDPGTASVRDGQTSCEGGCPYESLDRMQKDDLFYDKINTGGTIGPPVTVDEPWAQGKTVIDGSRISQYLEDNPDADPHLHKPWRRTYIVLNRSDGTEYTYDSDADGYPEYAPIAWWGTRSGNSYPPIVGPDDTLYQSNIYSVSPGTYSIPQGRVMGWRPGTPYLSLAGTGGAVDEPQALSAGGSTLFRSLTSDRIGSWTSLAGSGAGGSLWDYHNTLASLAPGYNEMWWGTDPNVGYPGLEGNYGTKNGIYHDHGNQNPIVPYKGQLFTHRGNAVIAFGPNPARGKLPTLQIEGTSDTINPPTVEDLQRRLEDEVWKLVKAGNLRPGYYNTGQESPRYLSNYFENPGDTLYTLALAYPHLSAQLQEATRSYLRGEFETYFDPAMYARRGWAEGAAREAMILPPEVEASMAKVNKSTNADHGWSWSYPQSNFYAMWRYAELFKDEDGYAGRIYELARSKLQVPVPAKASDDYFTKWPWELNGYIAGYTGFLKLQDLAGKAADDAPLRARVEKELARLLDLRASQFTKDTYWTDPQDPSLPAHGGNYHYRAYNVSRNFIGLTPELGDYLRQRVLPKVQDALGEYDQIAPYWFVSRYDATVDEGVMHNLYDSGALLQARAYILRQPYDELSKYLDVPAFERGDLFFIQNLVAVLEAPGS